MRSRAGHRGCKKRFRPNSMPLVTLSGLPLSGKTNRANELKAFLLESMKNDSNAAQIRNVILVNEEELGIDKKTAYIGIDGLEMDREFNLLVKI